MTETQTPPHRPRGTGGPPAGGLAIVSLALTIAGVLLFTAAPRVSALLEFGAAVPLGIYAATMSARLNRLGVRVPGPTIGLVGGVTAAIMLMLSALVSWTQSQVTGEVASTLKIFAFGVGGIGFAVGMGLLIAGIAVPAYILRLFPRWLGMVGLVIAGLSELSFLSLVVTPFEYLIPIARFLGGAWLIAAGFLLPTSRARRTDEQ